MSAELVFLAAYLGLWGVLLTAAKLTPLRKRLILRGDCWWLYIPLVSWLMMVFPLILPIPLGPIGLALVLLC
ncbi:MAG: hypothetical protein NTX53_19230 [candidate division WOR-3 bacterium]|nr:hypothetical protein [candidate division WOR-3 bacterium]